MKILCLYQPILLNYSIFIYTNWVLVDVLNSNTYSDINTALKASIENNNSTGLVSLIIIMECLDATVN
jgi:hypothetical protein